MSSAAILLAENRYTYQFFFHGKIFFTKKKLFEDFFHEVENPCVEIFKENKNCGFPQKCGKMEALIYICIYIYIYISNGEKKVQTISQPK